MSIMADHRAPLRAGADDVATVVDVLVSAFYHDPTWSRVFPDTQRRAAQHRRLWSLLVAGGMRYPWVWLSADRAATAVWIPPGGTELSDEQEADVEHAITEMLGADASQVLDLMALFEHAHPRDQPHYYLSLLGTHADHRGKGLGLRLLADTLELIDVEGMPAYLEASNPVNVALYARYGFAEHGSFRPAPDAAEVITMWRDPRRTG
jgi:GNAT superfamily N-acetyltransferase